MTESLLRIRLGKNEFVRTVFENVIAVMFWPLLAIGIANVIGAQVSLAQSSVAIQKVENGYRLAVNAEEFRIRGVGGSTQLKLLADMGGNAIRTWSTDGLDKLLDEAQSHQIKVCVGLWLGHTRHGFDYQNQAQVEKQHRECLAAVEKYKNHPAVLMWGIGNEMEGEGNNPAIWYAANHIARDIKRLDPNHPTMTVIAEVGAEGAKLKAFEKFCPDIDILGINSYGGVFNLPERLKQAGFSKPYIVTEHGPLGPWETGRTRWGAALEATSTEKGELYSRGYRVNAIENQAQCLGTFAFVWGSKQETTATWFGMLLPSGERLAAVDRLSEEWTSHKRLITCPDIKEIKLERVDGLKPGEIIKGQVVSSVSANACKVSWKIVQDSLQIGTGGDFQNDELEAQTSLKREGMAVEFVVPESGGAYRLFAYLSDGKGGAAVANVPFFVDAPMKIRESSQAKLPYFVYRDHQEQETFIPSGYMGNATAIEMDEECIDKPYSGKQCLRVHYGAKENWGGVLWQSPPNDWKGERPGGLRFSGAKAMEFWARGERGGEVVSFLVGGIEGNAPYTDTCRRDLKDVVLTNEWTKYRIDLTGADLTRIKTAFGWSLASQGSEVTFYLDDVQYVSK